MHLRYGVSYALLGCAFRSSPCVNPCRVEQPRRDIIGGYQKRYFLTSQDDTLSSGGSEAIDDRSKLRARGWQYQSDAQLLIDYAVNQSTIFWGRYEDLQVMLCG
jgi:hypothetical protein